MNSYRVQSAILPAILASSAVFSLLTFPFFSYRSQSVAENNSSLSRQLEPILTSENRDLTIRYIGGSMVLSVATGLATVELWRRRRRQVSQKSLQQPTTSNLETTLEPFDADVCDLNPNLTPNFQLLNYQVDDQDLGELVRMQKAFEPELTYAAERYSPVQYASEAASAFTSTVSTSTVVEPVTQPKGQVTELFEAYPTCRIRVKPLARHQFAIRVDEEFYGFFRLLPTRDAAVETAQQLSARQHLVVITPVEEQYAVWVWQPASEIESVSL
jgi:hypothetical protein